ncbi:MAG TPA: class I SAM-dependent methyltransferase [Actinophytocola sp.]|uniref:class I SAM-dependent DNA methyltransferase n=1 Tax=Actinophytocola sp. TaxID=1872138 RepID=UPI002F94497A
MIEPSHLTDTRESYDVVARDYADVVPERFAKDPFGRAMIAAFAEVVRGSVADLGCGPGQVTAHLAALGLDAFGLDLSPRMVAVAKERYPRLRFAVGSMTGLALADGALGGLVAWWSIVHTPPAELPVVFAEFHRVLAPGGYALVGFHAGDRHRRPEHAYGHPVRLDVYRFPPDRVAALLEDAGLTVTARLTTEGESAPQACLLARKSHPATHR